MFTLQINTDGSAFEDYSGHEVARILRALAKKVESGEEVDGAIFDLNGNKCGSWCLEAELAGDEQDEQAEAQVAGATWMETILVESENPEEWLGMNYQEFMQAAADVTLPAFPAFETTEETDAAYHGAWAHLEFSRKLFAQDAIYQEDLNRRKYPHSTEGWKEYDGR